MNDKIKELAEKCGFRSNPNIYDRNQSFDIEKFAELIVRECISAVEQGLIENPPEGDKSFCQGSVNGCKLAVSDIKQHFGVE